MSELERNVQAVLARQSLLPAYLRRDEETIRADEQTQALQRASFTRSKLTEEERLIAEGIKREEIALSNLLLVRNLPELTFESARYAHGLELQGRYREASDAHPIEEEKVRLKSIEEAIQRDDSEVCGCKPQKLELNGQQIEVYPHYEVRKIYSRRHGKAVSLVGCNDCGDLNATPSPPEQLQKILSAQKGVAVHDAHILKVS